MKNSKLSYIVKVAILAAVAAILMLFDIPIAFYKLDLSEVAALIGGFALGPAAAAIIAFLKQLINLLLDGSMTAGVGELSNFLLSVALSVPAAIIYKRSKSKKSALIGCAVGVACMMLFGAALNYWVLIPAYEAAFKLPTSAIIAMAAKVIPAIDSLGKLILCLTVPFNFVKGALSSIVVLLVYKKLSPLLHRGSGAQQ